MLIVIGFCLFGCSHSASNRRCVPLYTWVGGSLCFTQPDPPVALSWYDAQKWCQNIGATLPITEDSYRGQIYENAVSYFGLQEETLWLGANFTYDPNNWVWMNGSRFKEPIDGRNARGKTHACFMQNGTTVKFVAANPFENNSYISTTYASEAECAASPGCAWSNGRCFRKYHNYSWYSYIRDCNDLYCPSFDDLTELTRWLGDSDKYWMAVRSGWWAWQDFVTTISYDMSRGYSGRVLPDSVNGRCLSGRRNPYSSSDGKSCNSKLQFVCQERVNFTTTTTSKDNAYRVTTPEWINYFPGSINHKVADHGMAIGLGVGGGLLLLAVIVWLAILAQRVGWRKRPASYSSVDPPSQSGTTSKKPFDNYTFNAASDTMEGSERRYPYKSLNPAAKEYVY